MKVLTRTCLTMLVAVPLLLAGCGKSEADHREAFKGFLQTRVIEPAGLAVPVMSEEEKKNIGETYVQQYGVITSFHDRLNETVKPIEGTLRQGSVRDVGDLIARRDDLATARKTLADLRGQMDKQVADADAARAKLEQPADLKVVYDNAYDKLVTQPAKVYREIFPPVDNTIGLSLDVADYIKSHDKQVIVKGSSITVTDPAVQKTLNEKLQALAQSSGAVQAAQNKVNALISGRAQ